MNEHLCSYKNYKGWLNIFNGHVEFSDFGKFTNILEAIHFIDKYDASFVISIDKHPHCSSMAFLFHE